MFGFFKKKKETVTEQFPVVASYFLNTGPELKAISAGAFFTPPFVFLDMKICGEERDFFVSNNFFNLRATMGDERSWQKNHQRFLPEISQALNYGYDIIDGESYSAVFEDFYAAEVVHAWNIIRMVGVTQNAYTIGYIDAEQAIKNMSLLGKQLEEQYSSWEQVARDFISAKIEFNQEISEDEADRFSELKTILVTTDLLFNDKNSPLRSCLFSPDEDLAQSSNALLGEILSLTQRARNIMSIYKEVYGWAPFALVDDGSLNEKEKNNYDYLPSVLSLGESEEIVYMHAELSRKPEKTTFQLILTSDHLITAIDGKRSRRGEFVYTPLTDINVTDLRVGDGEWGHTLYLNDQVLVDGIAFNSKRDEPRYEEILRDIVTFVKTLS